MKKAQKYICSVKKRINNNEQQIKIYFRKQGGSKRYILKRSPAFKK